MVKKLSQRSLQVVKHADLREPMTKDYPSNLTGEEYALLEELLPAAKSGGRPRTVDLFDILNGILYVLVEGIRWRAVPGDFPPWQTVYTYFRNWRQDGIAECGM